MRTPDGRIIRGPGEPPYAVLAQREVGKAAKIRAAWLSAQTGLTIDPRTVGVTESLRAEYYNQRSEAIKAFDRRPEKYVLREPFEIRTSERKAFGACEQQWWWRYVEQLTPVRKSTPLWFGSLWHDALAGWYRMGLERGPHPAETLDRLMTEERKMYVVDEDSELEFVSAREIGQGMAEGYVNKYGRDERFSFIAVEQTQAIVFKRGEKKWLTYRVTFDGVYIDQMTGEVWLIEHKTAKQIKTQHLRLDNQAGAYYAAAPIVVPALQGKQLAGVHYNFARKSTPGSGPRDAEGYLTNKPLKAHFVTKLIELFESGDSDPVDLNKLSLAKLEALATERGLEVLGDRSKQQDPALFHREEVYRTPEEQITQLRRIREEASVMEQKRMGNPAFPILKTPGDHCNWCPFSRLCEFHEQGDEVAFNGVKATTMTTEDPYLAYHIHPKSA